MDIGAEKLSEDLRLNTVNLRTLMENTTDLLIKYGKVGGHQICIIVCESMTSTATIAEMIYRPLNMIGNDKKLELDDLVERITGEILLSIEQGTVSTYDELAHYIMSGFAVLLIDGICYGLAIGAQGYQSRGVEQAQTHQNLRSSREGFNEVIRVNVAMVRRRVKSPNMVFKMMTLGDRSHTDVCLCYIKDRVDMKLLEQIETKLQSIKISDILESGYLQPFLEDKDNALFSEVGMTERPDTLAAKMFEGRIGIIVDGTPFALYIPHLFIENFQTMDDYTGNSIFMGMTRLLKYGAFLLTILLPGFYVALANFHPELFPNSLLFSLSVSAASTPYPLLIECLLIHVIYEIMREAGLRLPTYVGHTVSIVGGLVIGEIVVTAGLVGAPVVLIAAVGAISSFIVPDLYDSIIVLRFGFMIAGGLWGFLGLNFGILLLLFKICSMSNYGIPYTAPITPFTLRAMQDTFVRMGWSKLNKEDSKVQDLTGVDISEVK